MSTDPFGIANGKLDARHIVWPWKRAVRVVADLCAFPAAAIVCFAVGWFLGRFA